MIHYKQGDLIKSVKTGTILHQVNCRGYMGAGFALQLKNEYPRNYDVYRTHCNYPGQSQEDLLGTVLCTSFNNHDRLVIINAFGQLGTGGRRATSYDALDNIFFRLYSDENNRRMYSEVNMPKIGSGLGGGNWKVIEQIILQYLPEYCNLYIWDFK